MKNALIIIWLAAGATACGSDGRDEEQDADADGDTGEIDAEEEAPEPVEPPSLELTYNPIALTDLASEAVAAAPDWLRDDMAINLARLYMTDQNELASLVTGIDDPYLIDEIGFAIAHTSPEVIQNDLFYPEILEMNARLVYDYDPLLDYVALEDVGVPGVDPDYHTTATYRLETSTGVVDVTIDPEKYYWYVVHPRLEDEMPFFVDGWHSGSGVSPDVGWFWREFLWDAAAEGCPSGRTCPLLVDRMGGIEVLRRLAEGSAYDNDAVASLYAFQEEVLDFGAGTERPIQPNRIYAVACGNCGEYADFLVASARTALVPARNAGASSNDHTWGEWWLEGDDWHGETGFYKGGVVRDLVDNDCDGSADDLIDDTDSDGDGLSVADGDCNDTLDTVHPGATEIQNGYDDDCDGRADTGFADADLDGDGDGYSISAGDCDDTDAAVSPGATEVANGLDDDCDLTADDGTDASDSDADGTTIAAGDCDDTAAEVHPGAAETSNGRDDDCDGDVDEGFTGSDRDGDGFTMGMGDCNDLGAGTNPDAQDPFYSTNRLYAITAARGDTFLDVSRTPAYATLPSYLEFNVTDRTGDPVDGALVTIYGTWEVYGHPESWAVASEVITDLAGFASLPVGEANPYGYAVTSAIGDNPGEGYLLRAVTRTEPWETYTTSTAVPGDMPAAPQATEADLSAGAAPEVALGVTFSVESYRIEGDGQLAGSFSREHDGGRVDAFLLDEAGYDLFRAGEAFEALSVDLGAAEATVSYDLPRTKSWILVLSNTGTTASTMVGSVSVTASPYGDITWTSDVPALTHRFRIPPGEHVTITLR